MTNEISISQVPRKSYFVLCVSIPKDRIWHLPVYGSVNFYLSKSVKETFLGKIEISELRACFSFFDQGKLWRKMGGMEFSVVDFQQGLDGTCQVVHIMTHDGEYRLYLNLPTKGKTKKDILHSLKYAYKMRGMSEKEIEETLAEMERFRIHIEKDYTTLS